MSSLSQFELKRVLELTALSDFAGAQVTAQTH